MFSDIEFVSCLLDVQVPGTSTVKMRSFPVILVLCSSLVYHSYARVYNKCSLALELYDKGIEKEFLPDWVCIADPSAFNTSFQQGPSAIGSTNFGIFQLNDEFWCRKGTAGGICNIECEKFTDNDITDDLACAKEVYRQNGFIAWWGWVSKCKEIKPDVNICFENNEEDSEDS